VIWAQGSGGLSVPSVKCTAISNDSMSIVMPLGRHMQELFSYDKSDAFGLIILAMFQLTCVHTRLVLRWLDKYLQ